MIAKDKEILKQQQNEITEYHIYLKLASISKDKHNKKILTQIAKDEYKHYEFWKKITKQDVNPSKYKIKKYTLLSRVFGLSFGLKLMEKGEEGAQKFYKKIARKYPQVKQIELEEEEHEKILIDILNDQRLKYAGAIVLGLNDALVELTGTLAGLTLAFANATLIAITGLILGVAASLSMAASEYLAVKEEGKENPLKYATYTGFAYVLTVLVLISPYFIFSNVFTSLGVMLVLALGVIASYTFYTSVAREHTFFKKFGTMAAISLGVAAISFGFGYLVKQWFGI